MTAVAELWATPRFTLIWTPVDHRPATTAACGSRWTMTMPTTTRLAAILIPYPAIRLVRSGHHC